jgi:hypothetical protein
MTKTRRPGKTIEEKKAQAEALHNSISDQVEQLRDTGRWRAFLDFAKAFHTYSIGRMSVFEHRECSPPAQPWRSAA